MPAGPGQESPLRLDDFVDAFEAARRGDPKADPARFLPAPGHSRYAAVLAELVRIDLEYHWQEGTARRLEEYRPRFPELFEDQAALQALAFEEYRLRRQAGECPSPAEYLQRFGFAVGFWPRPQDRSGGASPPARPGPRGVP